MTFAPDRGFRPSPLKLRRATLRRGRRSLGEGGFAQFALPVLLALFALVTPAGAETSDDYPSRPIRVIVPQAAGSGVDLQARVLAQKLGELWGQQGVVENRPGANAIVGMEAGARASP